MKLKWSSIIVFLLLSSFIYARDSTVIIRIVPSFHSSIQLKIDTTKNEMALQLFDIKNEISDSIWRMEFNFEFRKKLGIWIKELKENQVKKENWRLKMKDSLGLLPPPAEVDGISIQLGLESESSRNLEYIRNNEIILQILKFLEGIKYNSLLISEAIEDARRYLDNPIIKIEKQIPLTVKYLWPGFTVEEIEKSISQLPDSDILYLDIRNYEGELTAKQISLFSEKFKRVLILYK